MLDNAAIRSEHSSSTMPSAQSEKCRGLGAEPPSKSWATDSPCDLLWPLSADRDASRVGGQAFGVGQTNDVIGRGGELFGGVLDQADRFDEVVAGQALENLARLPVGSVWPGPAQ